MKSFANHYNIIQIISVDNFYFLFKGKFFVYYLLYSTANINYWPGKPVTRIWTGNINEQTAEIYRVYSLALNYKILFLFRIAPPGCSLNRTRKRLHRSFLRPRYISFQSSFYLPAAVKSVSLRSVIAVRK